MSDPNCKEKTITGFLTPWDELLLTFFALNSIEDFPYAATSVRERASRFRASTCRQIRSAKQAGNLAGAIGTVEDPIGGARVADAG